MYPDAPRSDLVPARRARRRRIILVTVAIVLATVLVGSGAAWAFDLFGSDDGPAAVAHRTTTTTARDTGGAELRALGPCQRSLTPEDPLRLWIAGDSLAGSLGPSLGKTTGATGVVQPVYDSRVSSGLGSPEFFDWPRHATDEMARLDPEVVVFIIGANDFRFPSPTPTDESGQPEWKAEYAQLVTEMLDAFESGGSSAGQRLVYWVGAPTMQDKRKDAGVQAVNEVARAVVAKHPRTRYVDAYKLFSGEDGEFTATLPGEDGEPIRVRAGDGIHLTPEGGDLLAAEVYTPLDKRCDLEGQAVPDEAKQPIKTKGSGESAGGSRSGSGSQGTTPPTAAPAVTPAGGTPTAPTAPKPNNNNGNNTPQTNATTPTSPPPPPTDPTSPTSLPDPPPDPPADTPSP